MVLKNLKRKPTKKKKKQVKELTHGVKINYSWGEEEPVIPCGDAEDAWKKAKKLAMKEPSLVSNEHDCKINLMVDKANNHISLYYPYDDTFCYYNVVEL